MSTSGPLESINIDGRRFPVDGEAAAVISLPGYTNEAKSNGTPGEFRIVKSAKVGKFGAIPTVIDNSRGDMEFIQDVMNSKNPVPFYATEVDQTVWGGSVTITGTPEKNTKEGVMEIEVSGFIKRQGA